MVFHLIHATLSNTVLSHQPSEIAQIEKQRTAEHQQELQRYIDEVKRSKQHAAVMASEQKRRVSARVFIDVVFTKACI